LLQWGHDDQVVESVIGIIGVVLIVMRLQ